MDLSLSEEQELLRKVAREFLANEYPLSLVRQMEQEERGYTSGLWQKLAQQGWLGLPFPEKYGGEGGSFLDLCLLLEEMGRSLLSGPYFSTVVLGGLTLLEAGSEEQKSCFLPLISQGQGVLTLALTEASASYEPSGVQLKAKAQGDEYILEGAKLFVPDAHVADYILCAARTGRKEEDIAILSIPAGSPGLKITLLQTMAGDKLCEVAFDHVRVPRKDVLEHRGWGVLRRAIERAAAALCCYMVGGAQRVLEMTVDYAKERKQFDRPIGSFQAIQHHCANMAIEIDGARYVSYQAAWRLSQGLPAIREVAIAKAWTGGAYSRACSVGHQVHGALAFTQDHDLQLYLRRAKAAQATYGDADYHYRVLARGMGL